MILKCLKTYDKKVSVVIAISQFFLLSSFRLKAPQQDFYCNEDDRVPVNKNELYIDRCTDISGVRYNLNESVRSCCECLM